MLSAPINTNSQGDNVVVPGSPGNIIRVTGYVLSGVSNNTLQWWSNLAGVDTRLLGVVAFSNVNSLADEQWSVPATVSAPLAPRSPWGQLGWFDTNTGEALVINLSDGNLVAGHVSYVVLSPNNQGL
jgi:hypothetical protein